MTITTRAEDGEAGLRTTGQYAEPGWLQREVASAKGNSFLNVDGHNLGPLHEHVQAVGATGLAAASAPRPTRPRRRPELALFDDRLRPG